MAANVTEMYAEKAREVARRYAERGYEVNIEPGDDILPEPLKGLSFDLLVRRGEEVIVIEIVSYLDEKKRQSLVELAEAVERVPGGRLDLVLLGVSGVGVATGLARLPSEEQISNRLQEAKKLLDAEQAEAALLLIWSALEGLLRSRLALGEGSVDKRGPRALVVECYSEGHLEYEDYSFLREMLAKRSSIVHGFEDEGLEKNDVQRLLLLVETLVKNEEFRREKVDD